MDELIVMQKVENKIISTLKDKVVGIYIHGSFVQSKLRPNSDLDYLIIINDDLSDFEEGEIVKFLMENSKRIGSQENKRYLEVTIIKEDTIRNINFPLAYELQYGEWNRAEYEKGNTIGRVIDNDIYIMLAQAKEHNINKYGKDFSIIFDRYSNDIVIKIMNEFVREIIDNINEDPTNGLLALCRMVYTKQCERFTSKDKAADYVIGIIDKKYRNIILNAKCNYVEGLEINILEDYVLLKELLEELERLISKDQR